jgi:hypothetical protein
MQQMNRLRRRLSLLFAVVVICQGCDSSSQVLESTTKSRPVTAEASAIPNAPWPLTHKYPEYRIAEDAAKISDADLQLLIRQGYGGDPVSAVLLAEHYAKSDPPDRDAAQKWRRIAAENGDFTAAITHALSLELKGGEENCLRAKFWLENAVVRLEELPRPKNGKKEDSARVVGLYSLRDNWQKCLDGNASAYIGTSTVN